MIKFFRCDNLDIPFITRYRQNELTPELTAQHVWKIFSLDIEYGKFKIQKKLFHDFFGKLVEYGHEN